MRCVKNSCKKTEPDVSVACQREPKLRKLPFVPMSSPQSDDLPQLLGPCWNPKPKPKPKPDKKKVQEQEEEEESLQESRQGLEVVDEKTEMEKKRVREVDFICAAKDGDIDKVKQYIEAGIDIDARATNAEMEEHRQKRQRFDI